MKDEPIDVLAAFTGDSSFSTSSAIASTTLKLTGWPMLHRDTTHSGYCDENLVSQQGVLWSYSHSVYPTSPVVADGKVFYTTSGGIECRDELSGGTLLFWGNYGIGGRVGSDSTPAVAHGRVFFANVEGTIYCLDENDGRVIWSRVWGGSNTNSSPAVAYGRVFIASSSTFYCLSESTGDTIWSSYPPWAGNDIWCSPAVANRKVFYAIGGSIYCADIDGNPVWKQDFQPFLSSPAVNNGRVFVGTGGGFYCLDENTGQVLWQRPDIQGVAYGAAPPSVSNGRVLLSTFNWVYCLNESTGNTMWSYSVMYYDTPTGVFYNAGIACSPVVANDKVFIGLLPPVPPMATTGFDWYGLHCLDINTGKVL